MFTEGSNETYHDSEGSDKPSQRNGRRKIKIEYIKDKNRRHITFSKRKAGIMKKAYELSTLTGTQILLLVVSETGLVYTFTTNKLQPIVTNPEGKNFIQACLNTPDDVKTIESCTIENECVTKKLKLQASSKINMREGYPPQLHASQPQTTLPPYHSPGQSYPQVYDLPSYTPFYDSEQTEKLDLV